MGTKGKRRVVILGSGQAALTTAYQLTDPRNPAAADLEVTVYQYGWRLGGKGAAGRSLDPHYRYRIEEHGLHNWFGFYDNAFRQIRDCYAELGRLPDAPLAGWKEAFIPESDAIFVEDRQGRQVCWKIHNPTNDVEPGSGGLLLPPWEYGLMALEAVAQAYGEVFDAGQEGLADVVGTGRWLARALALGAKALGRLGPRPLLRTAIELGRRLSRRGAQPSMLALPAGVASQRSVAFSERPASASGAASARTEAGWVEARVRGALDLGEDVALRLMLELLSLFMSVAWKEVAPRLGDDDIRHFWIMTNFVYAAFVGSVRDGVLEHGFEAIDDHDFRDWMRKHAYDDQGLMLDSALMRAVYDSSFAYVRGDSRTSPGESFPRGARFSAGVALHGLVRAAFTYKGAFGYKFAASTADATYAPMYEVLRMRGVRFEFFHHVLEVVPGGALGDPIQSVRIYRQADLRAPGYAPLIDVKGLPCWPAEPLWEQLEGGADLRLQGVDFEVWPETIDERRVLVLERGRDFDDVVLGISLAALPNVCPRLFELSAAWCDLRDHVETVRTMALQVWSRPTAFGLGWAHAGRPMTSFTYDDANYLNVWGDLSDLIRMEGWSAEAPGGPSASGAPDRHYPQNLAYFTTAMLDDDDQSPFERRQDAARGKAQVRATALRMMNQGLSRLWANARGAGHPPGFDWSLLVDPRPDAPGGEARLDAQYFRANVQPSERYVLSVPGSTRYRLQANNPAEFPNLWLTGDWTWCGLNAGCMEAATMSGMLCALAITGYPSRAQIVGVDFGVSRRARRARQR